MTQFGFPISVDAPHHNSCNTQRGSLRFPTPGNGCAWASGDFPDAYLARSVCWCRVGPPITALQRPRPLPALQFMPPLGPLPPMLARLAACVLVLLAAGCVTRPPDMRIAHVDPAAGYQIDTGLERVVQNARCARPIDLDASVLLSIDYSFAAHRRSVVSDAAKQPELTCGPRQKVWVRRRTASCGVMRADISSNT